MFNVLQCFELVHTCRILNIYVSAGFNARVPFALCCMLVASVFEALGFASCALAVMQKSSRILGRR